VAAYQTYLENHPGEWPLLDALCWIGISRFYRDRSVFQFLEHEVLPTLAKPLVARGVGEIRCWSAGCAGGEEPYTLAIMWRQRLAMQFPTLSLAIAATDIDPQAIQRGERGCYHASSMKDLPPAWQTAAFVTRADELCVKDEYRAFVRFMLQDIRQHAAEGLFYLILCRNLVFTYFDDALQRKTMQRLTEQLARGGALVIGKTESLPAVPSAIQPWSSGLGVYRRSQ
jgi:chemotaxis protein methyltransferase CheR